MNAKLNRKTLPQPDKYLAKHGLLKGKSHNGWTSMTCPVHKGGAEKNPSMSINLTGGHFRCHACGAKGGDIIALHRLITGLGFRDAVRDLGGRYD
jgi:DNA primase